MNNLQAILSVIAVLALHESSAQSRFARMRHAVTGKQPNINVSAPRDFRQVGQSHPNPQVIGSPTNVQRVGPSHPHLWKDQPRPQYQQLPLAPPRYQRVQQYESVGSPLNGSNRPLPPAPGQGGNHYQSTTAPIGGSSRPLPTAPNQGTNQYQSATAPLGGSSRPLPTTPIQGANQYQSATAPLGGSSRPLPPTPAGASGYQTLPLGPAGGNQYSTPPPPRRGGVQLGSTIGSGTTNSNYAPPVRNPSGAPPSGYDNAPHSRGAYDRVPPTQQSQVIGTPGFHPRAPRANTAPGALQSPQAPLNAPVAP